MATWKMALAALTVSVAAVGAGVASGQPEGKPNDRPAERPAGERQPGGERPGRGPGGPGGPGGPSGTGERAVSVEGAMKQINRGARQLRRQITDAAKKDDNLRILGDMERACIAAKGQPVPADVLEHAKDEAAKAKVSADYRRNLIEAARMMLAIEQDVMDGKGDDAKAKLGELIRLRDKGHEALGIKEGDEGDEGTRRGGEGRGGRDGSGGSPPSR